MSKLYSVKNWQSLFETNETRKLNNLNWWSKPNKHDGLGFRKIVSQRNKVELFCAWNLICDIASKTSPKNRRGYLERDNLALSASDLACMTGFDPLMFQRALDFFSSPEMAWLCVELGQQSAGTPADSPDVPAESPAVGKGREENGRKGIEGNRREEKKEGEASASPPAPLVEVFDFWNSLQVVPQTLLLSDKRRRQLQSRLSEPFFREHWKAALEKVKLSTFCQGKNNREWKATFDWFLQPDTCQKIMEKKYDNATANKPNHEEGF